MTDDERGDPWVEGHQEGYADGQRHMMTWLGTWVLRKLREGAAADAKAVSRALVEWERERINEVMMQRIEGGGDER